MKNLTFALVAVVVAGGALSSVPGAGACMTVSGSIELRPKPKNLPEYSFLTVEVADTSLMDAPADVLVSVVRPVTEEYNTSGKLDYSVVVPDNDRRVLTVMAKLNVGWRRSGDEWIRRGDYLTTTLFTFTPSGEKDNKLDIFLEHYA